MSRKYTKSNFADLLETLIPELYRNEDIQLSGLKLDPVLDLINRHVAAIDDGVLSISSIPDDPTTVRLDSISGMSQYFVKQNELTNISPYILESKILNPVSASLADFSTSSDFNVYLSSNLLPKIVPPTTANVGTLLDNIGELSSLVGSTETSAVHAHLVDTLGLMYFLNTSADGGLDYSPSSFVLDSLTKVFNGTTLQTVDGVKGLNAYLWNNLEVCSFTPYVPEDFESLDQLQTLTEVVYSPSYFDKDDTKVKEAFDDFIDVGNEQKKTVSAGPMRKLLAAMGYSIADISEQIENIGLIYDIENVKEEHLQYIAQLIGYRLRGNSSDKWRHQLRIAVDLYKKSGTLGAIQAAINALISETVFDVSGRAQELWECYLPNLVWYALGTESPLLKDLSTWTASKANLAEVGAYSTSSLENNLKSVTDAILLDLYKTYPENFIFFSEKFPVARMVEVDYEGEEGDVYTIINEPRMKEFFVLRTEDPGFQAREKQAIANGESKAWVISQGPLGEGVYFKGSSFPTGKDRPEYLVFKGNLEFVFSFRERVNWPLPPFEETKYYKDCTVTSDLVNKLVERLKCFQVRDSFADWLGQFIIDAAVTDSSNLGTLNEWLMFFDEPQTAENFDSVMLATSDYERNLLDLFSGKSSHLFIDFDGTDFDFAKTTLEGDGKYALYEASRIAKEFSPAHAITRVNLNATALDSYDDYADEYWDHLRIDYDDSLIGYSSGSILSNFENRGVALDFLTGGGDSNLGSDSGRGGLNTFKREFVDSIYDPAMADEDVITILPPTAPSNPPANYIVANELENNTAEQSRSIPANKQAGRANRPGTHLGGGLNILSRSTYFGNKQELFPTSVGATQAVVDYSSGDREYDNFGIEQIIFSDTGIQYTFKDQASYDQWLVWTPEFDIKWQGRNNGEWAGTAYEEILFYKGNPLGDRTPLTGIIVEDNVNFIVKYSMDPQWVGTETTAADALEQLVEVFGIVSPASYDFLDAASLAAGNSNFFVDYTAAANGSLEVYHQFDIANPPGGDGYDTLRNRVWKNGDTIQWDIQSNDWDTNDPGGVFTVTLTYTDAVFGAGNSAGNIWDFEEGYFNVRLADIGISYSGQNVFTVQPAAAQVLNGGRWYANSSFTQIDVTLNPSEHISYMSRPYGYTEEAWRQGPSTEPGEGYPDNTFYQLCWRLNGTNKFWESNSGDPFPSDWSSLGIRTIPNSLFGGNGADLILENCNLWGGGQWCSNVNNLSFNDPDTGDTDENLKYNRSGKLIWNNVGAYGTDPNGNLITGLKWGSREYALEDRELYDCDFANINKEHGIYTAFSGDFLMEGCTLSSIAAQGIQLSYRSSPFQSYTVGDNGPRTKETTWKVKDTHFYNCGDAALDGAARAAFTLTFFSPGSSQFPGKCIVEDCSVHEFFTEPVTTGGDRPGGLSRKTCVATRTQGTSYDVYNIPTITVATLAELQAITGTYRQLARVTNENSTYYWNQDSLNWEDWGDVTGNILREFRWSNCLIHTVKQGSTSAMSIRGVDDIVFDHCCIIYDRQDPNWEVETYLISIDSNPSDTLTTDGVENDARLASKRLRVSNCKGIGRNGGKVKFRVFRTIDPGTPDERDDWVWDFELDETGNVNRTKIIDLELLATTGTLQEQRAYNFANESLFVTDRAYDIALDGDYPSAEFGSGGGGTPPPQNDPPGQSIGLSPSNGAIDVPIEVICSWQSIATADYYEVYFDTVANGLGATPTATVLGTSFDPGTLLNSTDYIWRVDTVNTNGTTTGAAFTFTTESAVQDPPGGATNLSPANGATGVSIEQTCSWDQSTNATGYDVYFGTDPLSVPLVSPGQTGLVYDPGTLDYSTQYYWKVVSVGPGGTQDSGLISFTTESTPAPPASPPGSVTQGTPNGVSDVRIDTFLGWVASTGAETYDVYLDTFTSPTTLIADDTANTSVTPASNLEPGTTYFWRVDATNGEGTTTGSEFTFTTLPLPGEVENGGPNNSNSVDRNSFLNWDAATDAEEYLLYFGTSETPPLVTTTTSTSFDPGTMLYSTTYYWSVTARNSSGDTPMPTPFSFTVEDQATGGGVQEGSTEINRRALRRRNYKYLLPKEGYYDRTGKNAPVTWEVSSLENFDEGQAELALGYVASAGKFHPVVDPLNPSGVWDFCEGLTSPRSFSGLDTSNTFPYRGLDDMTPSAHHVDRDQLPGIYRTMHELLELKARDYAEEIVEANPELYSGDTYWKNHTQSLANSAIEDGFVLNSREEYDDFKFGIGLHKLFSDYNEYYETHGLAPHIWDQTGGNIFAHVFGKGLYNCDFKTKGPNWLRADGQSFFASSVDSGVSVNVESIWNDSSYDLVTENNLIRVGRFVGFNGWLNFQGIGAQAGPFGPDNSTEATTLRIEDPIGASEANQRTETTFDLSEEKSLEQPFTFNLYFKKILHEEGVATSQLRYNVSLGSDSVSFEEDLDIRFNTWTGAVDSFTEVTDGPGYSVSPAVPTANEWFRATVTLKDYAGTATKGRFVISPAPFEANSELQSPLISQVWNAECQKGEGFTEVFYGAGTVISTAPIDCVVPLSGTFIEGADFNAEFRNATILSGIDLVDISGAPDANEFKIFRLDPSKKITGESNFLVDNTFVKCRSLGGLPRMRFDLNKYGIRRNYFVPEHKFRLDVSALVGDERASILGGGQLGVWIHTVPRAGYFWSYTSDGNWTPMKTEDISIDNVISWCHVHTFESEELQGSAPACLNTLIQAASGIYDVNFNTIEEDFFKKVSFEFDTRNFTTQNNSEYLDVIPRTDEFNQVTPVVHDPRNNYVIEVFMVPQTNPDKFLIIDNIELTDVTLRESASIGTERGIPTKGVPLRPFVKEKRLYLNKEQLADVLKFYNGMVGSAAGEYTTALASRDYSNTEDILEVRGGGRLNYRVSPSWNTFSTQPGHNNYEDVEFEN